MTNQTLLSTVSALALSAIVFSSFPLLAMDPDWESRAAAHIHLDTDPSAGPAPKAHTAAEREAELEKLAPGIKARGSSRMPGDFPGTLYTYDPRIGYPPAIGVKGSSYSVQCYTDGTLARKSANPLFAFANRVDIGSLAFSALEPIHDEQRLIPAPASSAGTAAPTDDALRAALVNHDFQPGF